MADSDKALTWKQFTDICVKVQNYFGVEKKNDKFYAVPYYELSSAIWSNNADYFDEGAMNSAITSDEFVETVDLRRGAEIHGGYGAEHVPCGKLHVLLGRPLPYADVRAAEDELPPDARALQRG